MAFFPGWQYRQPAVHPDVHDGQGGWPDREFCAGGVLPLICLSIGPPTTFVLSRNPARTPDCYHHRPPLARFLCCCWFVVSLSLVFDFSCGVPLPSWNHTTWGVCLGKETSPVAQSQAPHNARSSHGEASPFTLPPLCSFSLPPLPPLSFWPCDPPGLQVIDVKQGPMGRGALVRIRGEGRVVIQGLESCQQEDYPTCSVVPLTDRRPDTQLQVQLAPLACLHVPMSMLQGL